MSQLSPWIFAAALLASGCPPKQEVRPDPALEARVARPPVTEEPPRAEAPPPEEDGGPLEAKPVYFALDSSLLADEGREELRRVASLLERHPEMRVTIAGHTCELGTSEYNLALGHRRAQAARDYLVRLGVRADLVETVSYGEERPAVEGQDEESLSKNRRCELSFGGAHAQGGQ